MTRSNSVRLSAVTWLVLVCARPCLAQLNNPFDRDLGQNTGLATSNWTATFEGLTPRAGDTFIATANGNPTIDFPSLSFTKALGGSIEGRPYVVSFSIAKYYGDEMSGIRFEDFSRLHIGGPGGSTTWLTTPRPTERNEWVQWTGLYTPAPSDVGQPFQFDAQFRLNRLTSVAFDGPVVATVVPEPAAGLATAFMAFACLLHRRRSR